MASLSGNRISDFSGSIFFDVVLDGIQLYSANTRDYDRNLFARAFNFSYGEFQNYNLTNFTAMKIINHVDFLQSIVSSFETRTGMNTIRREASGP